MFYLNWYLPLYVRGVITPIYFLATVIRFRWFHVLEEFLWKGGILLVFFETSNFHVIRIADARERAQIHGIFYA